MAQQDRSITTVNSSDASAGSDGEVHLASGSAIAMRMWREEQPADAKPASVREYETIGYVLSGRAELHIGGQQVELKQGDSWVVPRGTEHTYRILETFSAVEVTHPPYQG